MRLEPPNDKYRVELGTSPIIEPTIAMADLLLGNSRRSRGLMELLHEPIPRGSNVVLFWAVYYNPSEENRS